MGWQERVRSSRGRRKGKGGEKERTDNIQRITIQQRTSRGHAAELGRADAGLVGGVAGLDRRAGLVGACLLQFASADSST